MMFQFEPTSTFFPLRATDSLSEYVLLLLAQSRHEPNRWWTAGTAFLVMDRVAISGAHIFKNFDRKLSRARAYANKLSHLGPPEEPAFDNTATSFDAIQFMPNGDVHRWSVSEVGRGPDSETDIALLLLEPHPSCGKSKNYKLIKERAPRLQLVPPAVGQKIFVCGWPDDKTHHLEGGELPEPVLEGGFFFMSEGIVEHLSTTVASKERFDYPHFRTNAVTHSGMSGGPVLTQKNNGFVICGTHIGGDGLGLSRHSILWPMLYMPVPTPDRKRERSIWNLANNREINAPCTGFFQLDGPNQLKCNNREVQVNGTIKGHADWFVEYAMARKTSRMKPAYPKSFLNPENHSLGLISLDDVVRDVLKLPKRKDLNW